MKRESLTILQPHPKPDGKPDCAPVSLLGCAHGGKIHLCRQHWQQLPPHTKDRSTAKHLICAVEIAERLIRENNKLEMECREYRKQPNHDSTTSR